MAVGEGKLPLESMAANVATFDKKAVFKFPFSLSLSLSLCLCLSRGYCTRYIYVFLGTYITYITYITGTYIYYTYLLYEMKNIIGSKLGVVHCFRTLAQSIARSLDFLLDDSSLSTQLCSALFYVQLLASRSF